jgi:hypothetical protein
MGQIQDNENDLGMAAGHAISFIMLQGIQEISDTVGDETSLQGYRVEVGHGVSRSDGRKENVADKRNVVTKGQDKNGFIKLQPLILQIEDDHKNYRKEIITDISQRQEVRKPGNDPLLHPESRMDSKNRKIYLDQSLVDIGMEIMDQITQGLIDQDDEYDGRERMEESTHLSHPFSIRG